MTTSDFNAADGCNIVYSEDDTVPACSTNTDGRSNSAEFNGYNVYVRYIGDKLYPYDINPFAPAPYQFSVTATDDSYKSVEWTDAIQNVQCWEASWMSQDQARMWCDAYTGPTGTDLNGRGRSTSRSEFETELYRTVEKWTKTVHGGLIRK